MAIMDLPVLLIFVVDGNMAGFEFREMQKEVQELANDLPRSVSHAHDYDVANCDAISEDCGEQPSSLFELRNTTVRTHCCRVLINFLNIFE